MQSVSQKCRIKSIGLSFQINLFDSRKPLWECATVLLACIPILSCLVDIREELSFINLKPGFSSLALLIPEITTRTKKTKFPTNLVHKVSVWKHKQLEEQFIKLLEDFMYIFLDFSSLISSNLLMFLKFYTGVFAIVLKQRKHHLVMFKVYSVNTATYVVRGLILLGVHFMNKNYNYEYTYNTLFMLAAMITGLCAGYTYI